MSVTKKEIFDGKLSTIHLVFEGTEMLDLEELRKLTGGKSLEIRGTGDGVKLGIDLSFTSTPYAMEGRFQIELDR